MKGCLRLHTAWVLAGMAVLAGPALGAEEGASHGAVAGLKAYLAVDAGKRGPLEKEGFAGVGLTKADAAAATEMLWTDHVARIKAERAAEVQARELKTGEFKMPFWYTIFGGKPAGGRSLFISMHGGGNAPAATNDQQYENQKRLYKPSEGVYLCPRAPTNSWMLWHESHIDTLFDRLIEDLVVLEDVNPNRVYLMGYSAGGDGVYQLAPRMADRFAAASMMAGHPNDAAPEGLRNLPFSIHVGAVDNGFDRNKVAMEWEGKLAALRAKDLEGYVHWVKLYEGKAHWMDGQDAAAVPWMQQYTRNPLPGKVVWKQGNTPHERFYWLAVAVAEAEKNKLVTAVMTPAPPLPAGFPKPASPTVAPRSAAGAVIRGTTITLETGDYEKVTVRLSDAMCDLDKAVTVMAGGKQRFSGVPTRTIGVLAKTLAERGDPAGVFAAEVVVALRP